MVEMIGNLRREGGILIVMLLGKVELIRKKENNDWVVSCGF